MPVKQLKETLRPYRDFLVSVHGFIYDLLRYLRHSGYKGYLLDGEKRDFRAVKIYHRLEKSLSFRNRRSGAGASAAHDLIDLMSARPADSPFGFQEKVAFSVLDSYLDQSPEIRETTTFRDFQRQPEPRLGGTLSLSPADLQRGTLKDPEEFFLTRHSLRDFSNTSVEMGVIKRAIELALKTPSVCNRQAWHVYYAHTREAIDRSLSFQNGNSGFGHEIQTLLIVTINLKAFDTAGERNQGWVDGGMFAMSIIYALHSLGVGSCCLNWSKTPSDDRRMRKAVPIAKHHSIVMMIGVGYPKDQVKVCASPRRPVDTFMERFD